MKKKFLRDFSLVFFSNCIGFTLSITMNLILPIVFRNSISSYGYVQLYLLYVSYYYLFDFGLSNGIYLKEGGKEYSKLDGNIYSGQFKFLVILQSIFAIIIILGAFFISMDSSKRIIAIMVGINIVIMQIRTYTSVILQATNRMKEYSITTVIVKLLNMLAVLISLFVGVRDYRILIGLLTLGEFFSMLYSVIQCKDKIFLQSAPYKVIKKEIVENVFSGFNIIISGAAAMLMLGVARVAIESQWGIDKFAQISFTVSISNMFMLFINAISIVLYPKLRNTDSNRQISLYNQMRDILMGIMFFCISIYYPLRVVLTIFLPEYSESIKYMAILLPICLYTSKMSLLIQTYMKVIRIEKKMMKVNVIALIVSIVLTLISVFVFKSMTLSVMSMLTSQIFRTVLAEVVLAKELQIKPIKDIIYELFLTVVFVICNWYIAGSIGAIIFIVCVIIYLNFKRKNITNSLKGIFCN